MARKRYTPEEIIGHLRTVEIESGRGTAISGVPDARDHGADPLSLGAGVWPCCAR